MGKQNEIGLPSSWKLRQQSVCCKKHPHWKLYLHNNILGDHKATCSSVEMLLKGGQAWLVLGTRLIGSGLATATRSVSGTLKSFAGRLKTYFQSNLIYYHSPVAWKANQNLIKEVIQYRAGNVKMRATKWTTREKNVWLWIPSRNLYITGNAAALKQKH